MAESDVKKIKAKKKYVLVRDTPEVVEIQPKKILKRKVKIVRDEDIIKAIPITLGDEVQQALEEWYATRGETLPEEYVGFGAKVNEEERARFEAEMEAAYPSEPSPDTPKPLGPKPEFGTPEFWKWTWERRKQINAERAAAGLPPLPTKKEKEAAKAKKVAENEAKSKKVVENPVEVTKVKKIKKKKTD
jgi:hypothetical protein